VYVTLVGLLTATSWPITLAYLAGEIASPTVRRGPLAWPVTVGHEKRASHTRASNASSS
jgi:hypothetical protein